MGITVDDPTCWPSCSPTTTLRSPTLIPPLAQQPPHSPADSKLDIVVRPDGGPDQPGANGCRCSSWIPRGSLLAALFTNDAKLNARPIKLKDAYAVYIYDNTLYVVEATGQMIKDELEWTATYFNQYFYEPSGVTVNTAVRDYNYDLWSGIEYKLDVTKPVGQRVVELKLKRSTAGYGSGGAHRP